jgi:hypothetical protein
MKRVVLVLMLLSSVYCKAQGLKGHVSAGFGILNGKVRLQYEHPLKERASFGLNVNYYLVNWKGPLIEPFIRLYGKKDGNGEGFFGQFKLGYGNLSVLELDKQYVTNKRWNTFGGGIDLGYKFLIKNHFTIEPLFGLRLYTPPVYNYENDQASTVAEGVGWYLTTGMPFDFQLKFGYQF